MQPQSSRIILLVSNKAEDSSCHQTVAMNQTGSSVPAIEAGGVVAKNQSMIIRNSTVTDIMVSGMLSPGPPSARGALFDKKANT